MPYAELFHDRKSSPNLGAKDQRWSHSMKWTPGLDLNATNLLANFYFSSNAVSRLQKKTVLPAPILRDRKMNGEGAEAGMGKKSVFSVDLVFKEELNLMLKVSDF